jgi:excisionase family DNA binding protein
MTDYLKPAEVAALLGVNAKTVKRWIRAGKLDAIKTPGGHWRIPTESVERLKTRAILRNCEAGGMLDVATGKISRPR